VYNTIRSYNADMESEAQKLGKNLKRIRTKKGISQGDIVRSLGMDRAFISNIENGKTNPTLATITKIAKAIGVSVGELMK
jgi:transcriptional regulator with XRE-family HTH domain